MSFAKMTTLAAGTALAVGGVVLSLQDAEKAYKAAVAGFLFHCMPHTRKNVIPGRSLYNWRVDESGQLLPVENGLVDVSGNPLGFGTAIWQWADPNWPPGTSEEEYGKCGGQNLPAACTTDGTAEPFSRGAIKQTYERCEAFCTAKAEACVPSVGERWVEDPLNIGNAWDAIQEKLGAVGSILVSIFVGLLLLLAVVFFVRFVMKRRRRAQIPPVAPSPPVAYSTVMPQPGMVGPIAGGLPPVAY